MLNLIQKLSYIRYMRLQFDRCCNTLMDRSDRDLSCFNFVGTHIYKKTNVFIEDSLRAFTKA